jgi:hypothetical protein
VLTRPCSAAPVSHRFRERKALFREISQRRAGASALKEKIFFIQNGQWRVFPESCFEQV